VVQVAVVMDAMTTGTAVPLARQTLAAAVVVVDLILTISAGTTAIQAALALLSSKSPSV
jgi:hypothetical protein